MDYNILLDLATDLGHELALSGAETFRVEESINRIIGSYGVSSEAFAIPNYLIVSIITEDGRPITRMRRIGAHGNDLDSVERLNGLSRRICDNKPDPLEAMQWLDDVCKQKKKYTLKGLLLGDFIGAAGYGVLFGCGFIDMLCAGLCGILIGIVNHFMDQLKSNPFFNTVTSAFFMALLTYTLNNCGIVTDPDAVNIGALMILVPGLLFTNAMRDIIYGDINSGINRIVQVVMIAGALSLGTAVAWNLITTLWCEPDSLPTYAHPLLISCAATFIGCIGFSIVFNIHGPGMILCALGGMGAWFIYSLVCRMGYSDIVAYFWGSAFAAAYAEIMARVRKYPAISYLVVSIFPLIPGAGAYYTMNYAFRGNMEMFGNQAMHTAAIAGVMAVGILLASTIVRMVNTWNQIRHAKLVGQQ